MKIAIGYDLKTNSWGGGNQFATSLAFDARLRGYEITFDLKDKDIDLILLTDPRSFNKGVSFGSLEILFYLLFKNKNAIVVHRINECDERKNTKHMNRFLRWSNYCADFTVFIATWLKDLDIYQKDTKSCVILNGGDSKFFNHLNNSSWDGKSPLKIVTHHWSPNYMKGFDVYKNIDNLLTNIDWGRKIEFTYIGNLPKGFKFKKTKHLKPISGKELGIELSKHHIYLSASINEPAGMHHIEGALCGLPIIYRESGALPEYCMNYGIPFKNCNYLPALNEMFLKYSELKRKIYCYPFTSKKMTDEYLSLFSELVFKRAEIIKNRNLFKNPYLLIKNFLFLFLQLKNVVKFLNNTFLKRILK